MNSSFNISLKFSRSTRTCIKGLTAIIVSLSAVACGNSDNPATDRLDFPALSVYGLAGQPVDQAVATWYASISSFRSDPFPESGDMSVRTLQYTSRSVQDEIDFRSEQIELDTCIVEDDETGGGTGGGGSPPYVSGGPSVTINAPSGPWLTIDIGDDLRYDQEGLPGPLPANASLSIPGDVFPTVGAYPLFEPQIPVRLSPATDAAFDVDAAYSWVPGQEPGTYIVMDFREFDLNGNFLGFPAACQVEDDGEFALPPDVASALATSTNSIDVRYARKARRIDFIDGIMYFQSLTLAE